MVCRDHSLGSEGRVPLTRDVYCSVSEQWPHLPRHLTLPALCGSLVAPGCSPSPLTTAGASVIPPLSSNQIAPPLSTLASFPAKPDTQLSSGLLQHQCGEHFRHAKELRSSFFTVYFYFSVSRREKTSCLLSRASVDNPGLFPSPDQQCCEHRGSSQPGHRSREAL